MGRTGTRLAFAAIIGGLVLAFGLGGREVPLAAGAARATPTPPRGGSPPQAAGLVGGTWGLVTLQAAGGPVEDTAGAGLTIAFGADGRAGGSGGCNSFGAAYAAGADGSLRIGELAATLIGCAPPTGEREARYFATLLEVRRYATDGATLRLGFELPGRQLVFRRAMPVGGGAPGLPNTGAGGQTGGAGDLVAPQAAYRVGFVVGLLFLAAGAATAITARRQFRADGRPIRRR